VQDHIGTALCAGDDTVNKDGGRDDEQLREGERQTDRVAEYEVPLRMK